MPVTEAVLVPVVSVKFLLDVNVIVSGLFSLCSSDIDA